MDHCVEIATEKAIKKKLKTNNDPLNKKNAPPAKQTKKQKNKKEKE